MPDGDAHRLPGTLRPGSVMVVVEAGGHVVGVRWQAVVDGDGRRRAAVELGGEENVLGILVQQLVVSAGGVGGGRGGMELGKGRVVN